MRRLLSAAAAAAVISTIAMTGVTNVSAQTTAKSLACATLLTSAEITKATGDTFTDMGPRERTPGETECSWMLRGGASGFKTVSVQFYDLAYMKANELTPEKVFENVVTGAEGMSTKKRESLPGIGLQAAFVAADPQVMAAVRRADGVARIVGNNLTKAQITAVAGAVAAP